MKQMVTAVKKIDVAVKQAFEKHWTTLWAIQGRTGKSSRAAV